jgi:hypothetical protein
MYQPVNSVCHHDLLQSLKVQYVSEYIRTWKMWSHYCMSALLLQPPPLTK